MACSSISECRARAAGRRDQGRLAGQRFGLEHVEEHLEQPAVRGAEHRRDCDQSVGVDHPLDQLGQPGTRESGHQAVGQVLRVVAQLDDLGRRFGVPIAQRGHGRRAEPITEQPGRRWLAQSATDDDDLVHRTLSSSSVLVR
jgi:hypothetical protein